MSGWQVLWETGRTVSAVVVGLGGPGLIAWFIRDRRKENAATTVAEQTVESEVEIKETGALEARLIYVQREMDLERGFHQQQLADRDAEIERQRAELVRRDERIARLLEQVGHLEGRLADMTREVTSMRDQLTELRDHTTEEHR